MNDEDEKDTNFEKKNNTKLKWQDKKKRKY